ncbi:MAG: type VI secretion system-associated protein TagF [Methylococcaceae bacterium]
MKLTTSAGFYGKLPIVGDFVSRRLPNEFISSWDGWLQSAIAASREELGNDWLTSYLTSPIWRFLLSPGLCGNQAVAGIMMPSVDRVGRYYPLTVAVLIEPSIQLPLLFTSGNVWFEQLEDAALSGLEGNLDVNAFDQLIQSIPSFELPVSSSLAQNSAVEKKYFHIAIENVDRIGDAFVQLNSDLLASFMPGYSLWHSTGSEHVQPALLACQGLPAIGRFSEFLKGQNRSMPFEADRSSPTSSLEAIVQALEPEHPSLSSILASDNPALPKPSWRSWAVTDTGKRRKHNEDSLLDRPEAGLWVVADGMGGHQAGDVASQLIVNRLQDLSPTSPLEDYISQVESCLQKVNTELRELATKEYGNHLVGSTVVALVCESQRCGFLWAGDSRLYRFRNNELQQLTRDHCAIEDEEASSGWAVKSSNVITRAIGADQVLELDLEITEILEGDVFLLSSDGLDKEISFKEIEHMIQIFEPQDLANALINETLSRGARDNVTVIVVAKY